MTESCGFLRLFPVLVREFMPCSANICRSPQITEAGDEASPPGFILDDFAYAAGLGILFDYQRFDLPDSSGIAEFLEAASSVVRGSGDSLFRGDLEAFRELQSKADERDVPLSK